MKTETIVGIFVLIAVSIFFYMTFFLGVFRFNRFQYHQYIVYFQDASGLEKKADVKIAGVNVGWVENISLVHNNPYLAKASIMVHKQYVLYTDAYAVVRQDGIIGTKYLEIIPGDSSTSPISPDQALGQPGRSPASIDTILYDMQQVAHNVNEVTHTINATLGDQEKKAELQTIVENMQKTVAHFASFSSVIDRTLSHNEHAINELIIDLKDAAHHIKESFPRIQDTIAHASTNLDKNIGQATTKMEHTAQALEEAATQARDGFKNIGSITEKIDAGQGMIGKLINEDETYRNLQVTVQGLKSYFAKINALTVIFDSHGEYMYRPAEHVNFEDAKGYLDVRVHPNEDYFYLLQYVMTQRGNINRHIREVRWYDEDSREIKPSEFINFKDHTVNFLPELVGTIETRKRTLDKAKYGLQIGKLYKNVVFRIGIIESAAGFGLDFHIPFGTDIFRWVSTFEAFDFKGRDRFDDKRPHLKWINRLFLLRNIYMAFGADDFISKNNANGFFGGGIRFCDDDIKYFLAQIGFGALG